MAHEEMISDGDVLRVRVLQAAAELIRAQGPEAATTRAVALAAGIQPPTLYRLIGDKKALLDAVAEFELATYIASKRNEIPDSDPVEDLRRGWDRHVEFGLANAGLFRIMSSNADSPAAAAGLVALKKKIHTVALAARLRGTEECAAAMMHAACVGVVLALLADPQASTAKELSAQTREALLDALTVKAAAAENSSVGVVATTLRARLEQSSVLTPGERGLLDELLQRISQER